MTTIHAGATVQRPPGPKYAAKLTFAELTFPSSWPRPKTLAKWRQSAPDLRCAIVAPHGASHGDKGPFRWDEGLEDRFDWYLEALEVLNADAVITTGSDVSTAQRDRDRLAAFLERIPRREGRHIVWAPKGLWTLDLAGPFAKSLDVLCAFDPLEDDDLPVGTVGYARMKTIGGRQRFSEGLLYEIVEALESSGYEEAFVALESERSFQEASRLQEIAREDS